MGGHVYPNGDAIFCDMVKVSLSMTDHHQEVHSSA